MPVTLIRGEWIIRHYKNLKRSQYYSEDHLRSIQLAKLNKLICHARSTVPYYSNLPHGPLDSLENIQQIPMIEKQSIRGNEEKFYSSAPGFGSRYKTSGGSTGAPVTIRKNSSGMAKELAATWRGCSWAGVDIGDKQARFWGVPHTRVARLKAKLIDFIAHRVRFSAFSFSDENLKEYANRLDKEKPSYYYGYTSMIRRFAEYLEETSPNHGFRPKAIITTAEVLRKEDREIIERVFGCKVFNEYGCGEIGTIAHECQHGSLHINAENILVEVLDEFGNWCSNGVAGELVVTDLTNYSMPLIRYRLKDFSALSGSSCSCGIKLPSLKEIYGREYNYLVNTKGQKFHGEFFLYFFEDLKKEGVSMREVQIIQKRSLDLMIKVVSDEKEFSIIEKRIGSKISENFDRTIKMEFIRTAVIPRETSGKLIVVKSEVLNS